MKKYCLIALLLALPLVVTSQTVIFSDTFANSSTLTNALPASPTVNSTAYEEISSKPFSGLSLAAHNLTFGCGAGSTSTAEIEALFTTTPVTLNTVGDYVQMTVVFTNFAVLTNASGSQLGFGMFNSGQIKPFPGGINGAANSSSNLTGYAQLWAGYAGQYQTPSATSSKINTRPAQTAVTTANNQDLVLTGSGTTCYSGATQISGGSLVTSFTLSAGAVYTEVFTIAMNGANTNSLTITNALYSGDGTGGTVLCQYGGIATNATYLTNAFDSLDIGYRGTTQGGGLMAISNITVVASVAGAPIAPGPTFGVSGGGFGCPSELFVTNITLSGSVTTNQYLLYTNGVFSGVVSNGTGNAISFNSTIRTGPVTNTIVATNSALAVSALMSGSAVVAPYPAPAITTQPAAVIVATNSIGVFAVVASGNGLTYQWHRNGTSLVDGGHITGSATATLLISPANTADVFGGSLGYYCTVSNSCGAFVLSATNSLTLDAPGNLVWQGGYPANTWDVATSVNFTNAAGSPTVFNNGDNVTLDDSSTYQIINTVGDVAPGILSVAASANNYAIAATSSALIGPGSLVMSGSGTTLTISNANSFMGGTTISNGTVSIQNYGALGSGNVTLAGGTLVIPKGGSTTGLTNNITVTGNSTLQYAYYTTSYSGVLWDALGGNVGTTLTISESDSTANTARLRLYGSATNNANIVLTTMGATNEIAPYSGTQVYNGVISGNGHFITRGATVILNSTNTLSDGTYSVIMSGGILGLGADSTFSTPPSIQSSPIGTNNLLVTTADQNTLIAEGGARTLGNGIQYYTAVSSNSYTPFILGGSNKLTLAGKFQLAVSSPGVGTNCLVNVANTAATVISGQIIDGGVGSGLIKSGNGSLYLDGANTYTGATTNTAGLLAGTGSLVGPVAVNTNASLGGGSDLNLGTLTINNNLVLSGNVFIRVNKSLAPAQSNDLIAVTGTLNNLGSGTVTVSNLGPAIVAGDKFKLFSSALAGGNTLAVTGGGMTWTNRLAVDGTIQALAAGFTTASYPTNIVCTNNNNGTLTISWPATHLGWELMVQTNTTAAGLGNSWVTNYGTAGVNTTNLPINPTNGAVFYKLVHP